MDKETIENNSGVGAQQAILGKPESALSVNWLVDRPFAHRGLHTAEIPENSLASFSEAITNNYGVEIDVRSTFDGVIVVFHDDKLSRMTGVDGYINTSTYEGIKNLKLLKSEEHIPTLKEALELINGKIPVLIEIKNNNKVQMEKSVYEVIKNYKGDLAIFSNNPNTLEWFKLNAPQIKRGQRGGDIKNEGLSRTMRRIARKLLMTKQGEPNFICYEGALLPCRYTRKHKDLPLIAWVSKSKEQEDRIKKYSDNFMFENYRP